MSDNSARWVWGGGGCPDVKLLDPGRWLERYRVYTFEATSAREDIERCTASEAWSVDAHEALF